MDMQSFTNMNIDRCQHIDGFNHYLTDWSLSDWITATVGELGEAANIVKKLNRVRDGIPGNKEKPEQLIEMLGDEIADTFCYLDLFASAAGFNLQDIVIKKFNEISLRRNCAEKFTVEA